MASGDQRESYLTQSTGGYDCQTLQIGEPWTSGSPVECYAECMVRFPDSCQSIVYNAATKNCRPGSVAFGLLKTIDTSIPGTGSVNEIIYFARQPVPPCDSTEGFALYDVCGTTACLYLSTDKTVYSSAVANCSQLDARLFVANTMIRFSLFWHVSLHYLGDDTLLGLTDIAEEGKFVWANGEPLSSEQDKYIWAPGMPNNRGGNEHCAQARHGGWSGTDLFGLNDNECWWLEHYICEPLDW